jgi:superfamily I DNA/RNA helicase/RecB family exonuclease
MNAVFSEIVERPVGQTTLVVGAPGSGKTTLLADRMVFLRQSGVAVDSLMVVTPSRAQASVLRDRLGLALGETTLGPRAKSLTALAFAIVASAHRHAGLVAPDLLSASQIDADIESLLTGHLDDKTGPDWPEPLTDVVRSLPIFRSELREWMARATENGLDPARIAALAAQFDYPQWAAASTFVEEYRRVQASSRPGAFDSAEIIRRAIVVLEDGLPPDFAGLRHLGVDDAQDLTAAGIELLGRLKEAGVGLTVVAEPDVAGNTFRGSEPDGLRFMANRWGLEPEVLPVVYRQGVVLREAVAGVTQLIGAAGMGLQRRATGKSDRDGVIHTLLAPSPQREAVDISRFLQDAYLHQGVGWDRMLVIARRGARVSQLVKDLTSQGIPARASLSGLTLRDQPAARELLDIIALGIGITPLTPAAAVSALTGHYGGMNQQELRRLRFALRVNADSSGSHTPAGQLLAEALSHRGGFSLIDPTVSAKAVALATLLDDVRRLPRTTPVHHVVWQVWSASGVGAQWARLAAQNSEPSGLWHRRLDVVVALFHQATEFAEANPGASVEVFLDAVLEADVPDDVVLPTPVWPAVTVATPSGVAGMEADVVVIAGVDEGVWPDLRLRGSLLLAHQMVRSARGGGLDRIDDRKTVRDDELRLFAMSLSRATRTVLVCASDSEDAQPSPLFHLVDAPERRIPSQLEPPLSPRSVVGRLRLELLTETSPDGSVSPRGVLRARDLATLASWGIPGADPSTWWGLADISTTVALYHESEVPVSPSSLEALEESPVEWFLSSVARNESTPEMGLGSLLHRALENNPEGKLEQLWSVVDASFSQLEYEAGWVEEYQRRIAIGMVGALADYVADRKNAGFTVVAKEKRFQMRMGRAVMTGVIDRVEQSPEGSLLVVDLKTGRHKTDKDVIDNPQMLAYQLALEQEDFQEWSAGAPKPSAGAVLLFVKSGVGGKRYRVATQEPLTAEDREAFFARIEKAVSLINAAEFTGGPREFGGGGPSRHRWHFVGQVCGDV